MMRVIVTAAMCFVLASAFARADRRIDCPPSTAPLVSAAPILGRLEEPWGELHEVESARQKDATYILRYDLTGGEAPQLEKWLVCRYRDQSYKAIRLPALTRECRIRTKVDGPADSSTKRRTYRVADIVCG